MNAGSPVRPAPMLILDFDDTLVDTDSSEWVAEQLGAAPLFDALRRGPQGMPWHQAMNSVLCTLHSQGCTVARIRQALSQLPLPLETLAALKAAHSLGCELRIVSDANTFFIEAFLAHHGLDALFTHIHSNPAWVDANGCLCYDDFHGDSLPPHHCPLCPPNMCKGSIVHGIQAAAHDPAIIYAGDGSGDLCPSLRLSKRDHVLPRVGYPLATLLAQHQVKARVHPWTSLTAALQESLLECVKNGDLDVPLYGDGPLASSSCVASSFPQVAALLGQRDEETFRKGSVVASATCHRIKSRVVHKTNCSLWRGSVVMFVNCFPSGSFHMRKNITSLHSKTSCSWMSSNSPLWRIHANASHMSRVVVCNRGHPFQAHRVPCSV